MLRRVAVIAIVALTVAVDARAGNIVLPTGARAGNVITQGTSGAPASISGTDIFNGVSRLFLEANNSGAGYGCSGSLLWSGRDILTAAHCVVGFNLTGVQVEFLGAGGAYEVRAGTAVYVHPDYVAGEVQNPHDLAIIRLDQTVVGAWERYDINRTGGEAGQVGTFVGYGWTGNGVQGSVYGDGERRYGYNLVDFYWTWSGTAVQSLAFDFDNGLAANNAFGRCINVSLANLGMGGGLEAMTAPGDSGGPVFIAGRLAGVSSWIGSCGPDGGDINNRLDSSFGEFGGSARLFEHYQWVDSHVVPEPGSLLLIASGCIGLLARRLYRHS